MPEAERPVDHAGLEILSFAECLRLAASVPVGRIAFTSDGEVVVLPVNHAVDGQGIVFRTGSGAKLSAAEEGRLVAFEADSYDARSHTGWSVLINGRAEIVYDETEAERLGGLGVRPWVAGDRPFWIRVRPISVTGRQTPDAGVTAGRGQADGSRGRERGSQREGSGYGKDRG